MFRFCLNQVMVKSTIAFILVWQVTGCSGSSGSDDAPSQSPVKPLSVEEAMSLTEPDEVLKAKCSSGFSMLSFSTHVKAKIASELVSSPTNKTSEPVVRIFSAVSDLSSSLNYSSEFQKPVESFEDLMFDCETLAHQVGLGSNQVRKLLSIGPDFVRWVQTDESSLGKEYGEFRFFEIKKVDEQTIIQKSLFKKKLLGKSTFSVLLADGSSQQVNSVHHYREVYQKWVSKIPVEVAFANGVEIKKRAAEYFLSYVFFMKNKSALDPFVHQVADWDLISLMLQKDFSLSKDVQSPKLSSASLIHLEALQSQSIGIDPPIYSL